MSQRNGAAFERHLSILHANYRRLGLAHIFKVPDPTARHGKGDKVSYHKTKAVWTDFAGVLSGGVAVALEAKYTQGDGPSFPLGKISPGQRDVLTSVHEMGGVSALIVRRGCVGAKGRLSSHDYLVPTSFIDSCEFKSFRWTAVERYRIPAGSTWIDAIDVGGILYQWGWYAEQGWPQWRQ